MDNRIDSSFPVSDAASGSFGTSLESSIRRAEPRLVTNPRYAQTYSRPRRLTTRHARTRVQRLPSTPTESIVFGASRATQTPCLTLAALASPDGHGAQPN